MKIHNAHIVFEVREDGPAVKLNKAELVVEYMKGAFDFNPDQESFWVILLNRKDYPKGRQMVTLGTATSALAHPREVFRAAIMASATAIICVHNHPSGDPAPSIADTQLTNQLRDAARIIQIELHDHVIIGDIACDPTGKGYYSYRQVGLL